MAALAERVSIALAAARSGWGAASSTHSLIAALHGSGLRAGGVVEIRLDRGLRAAQATGDLRDGQTLLIAVVPREGSCPTTLLNTINASHRRVSTGRRITTCGRSEPARRGRRDRCGRAGRPRGAHGRLAVPDPVRRTPNRPSGPTSARPRSQRVQTGATRRCRSPVIPMLSDPNRRSPRPPLPSRCVQCGSDHRDDGAGTRRRERVAGVAVTDGRSTSRCARLLWPDPLKSVRPV